MFYKIPLKVFFCGIIVAGSGTMYSLLIDTHDKDLIIALYEDGKVKESNIKESLRNHSDFTMPMIDEILKNNNITVNELNEILVINGPGSFTGVRIGVTIAKMLAYTLNIPIKAISSLEMYSVSKNIDTDKLVIIRDIKGVFGAVFTKVNSIKEDFFYKANADFEEYVKTNNYENIIVENPKVDLESVYDYMKNIEPSNPHSVNPIYIKVIEALKND